MVSEEQIRKRTSYKDWESVLKDFTEFGLNAEQLKEVLLKIHNAIDRRRGYRFYRTAYYSAESLGQLLMDRRLLREPLSRIGSVFV